MPRGLLSAVLYTTRRTDLMIGRPNLAICLEYPIDLQGGVSVLCRALIEDLSAKYAITLVSPDQPESLAGVDRCLHRHIFWNPEHASRATGRVLAERLSEIGVEIAHFHFGGNFGWGSRIFGGSPISHTASKRIRVFSTIHLVTGALEGYCDPKRPRWLKLALFPFAWAAKMNVLSHVCREIAVSRHDFTILRRCYWPLQRKLVQVYHSRLSPKTTSHDAVPREPIILNVGHIAIRKGQPDLVEAFAHIAPRHRNWRLVLVGHFAEASAERKIRELINSYNLHGRVILPGPVPDPSDWMLRAGIYVQPSRWEALGLALQEAMFLGVPSIGSEVGGIPEMIAEGTGLLFPAADVQSLAAHLDELINNPEKRARIGRAGAEAICAKGMTRHSMVERHIELYEGALKCAGAHS